MITSFSVFWDLILCRYPCVYVGAFECICTFVVDRRDGMCGVPASFVRGLVHQSVNTSINTYRGFMSQTPLPALPVQADRGGGNYVSH
eukprot:m.1640733 g.1640733  ORF g.1640733 m.1640733 type:complete len:88 (-) comp43631_c0_seq1:7-270(-)